MTAEKMEKREKWRERREGSDKPKGGGMRGEKKLGVKERVMKKKKNGRENEDGRRRERLGGDKEHLRTECKLERKTEYSFSLQLPPVSLVF